MQKKWTSFLKTRIDCPVLNSKLPYIIQDSYLWCDFKLPWQNCIIFAIFTSQSYVLTTNVLDRGGFEHLNVFGSKSGSVFK